MTIIPNIKTNEDKGYALIHCWIDSVIDGSTEVSMVCRREWWNAPYKGGERMKAKLVSVTEPEGKPIWFRTYEFECIDCGKHFIRHRFDSRTNPYCGGCQRKYENERQRERIKAKKQMAINDVLDKISAEIELEKGKWDYLTSDTCFDIAIGVVKRCKEETEGKRSRWMIK